MTRINTSLIVVGINAMTAHGRQRYIFGYVIEARHNGEIIRIDR